LRDAKAEHQYICAKLDRQMLEVRKCFEDLQKKRAAVRELTSGINIHPDVETYSSAYESAEKYADRLNGTEVLYNRYVLTISNEKVLTDQKQDLKHDADNLQYEINVLENKILSCWKKIEALRQALKELGLEEIEREIEFCIRRLEEIPKEITDRSAQKAKLEERVNRTEKDLVNTQYEISIKEEIYNIFQGGLKKELQLGFVKQVAETENVFKLSKDILNEYRDVFDRTGFDREKFTERLQNVYFETRNELLEYGLSMDNVFDEAYDGDDERIKAATNKQRRLNITANINGKAVSLYALYSNIEEDIAANENLLRETDRHLFEEIIMHNVGIKIRAKIFKAEE
jgi:hypothetical protein